MKFNFFILFLMISFVSGCIKLDRNSAANIKPRNGKMGGTLIPSPSPSPSGSPISVYNPRSVGSYRTNSVMNWVTSSGTNAYIALSGDSRFADGKPGLLNLYWRYETEPRQASFIELPEDIYGVTLGTSYVYASGLSKTYVIPAATANPTVIATMNDSSSDAEIAISGNYAFFTQFNNKIAAYNISDPLNMTKTILDLPVGSINYGYRLATHSGILFTSGFEKLCAFRIEAGPSLTFLSCMDLPEYEASSLSRQLVVRNGTAYVSNSSTLYVVDVLNPQFMKTKSKISVDAWSFAFSGTSIFLATGRDGIQEYDISDPAAPKKKLNFQSPSGLFYWGIAATPRGLLAVGIETSPTPFALLVGPSQFDCIRGFGVGYSPESAPLSPAGASGGQRSDGSVSIQWPLGGDGTTGYLLVRFPNPLQGSWNPTNGIRYTSNSVLEFGVKPIYVGDSTSAIETGPVPAGSYYYAVYAFDQELRYSSRTGLFMDIH